MVKLQTKLNPFTGQLVKISDITKNTNNNIILAFNQGIDNSKSRFNLIDGIVDVYTDETSIDTSASTNESYDSSSDFYEPTGSVISDNDNYEDDMSDLSSWTDADEGGTSTQETFDSREVMQLLTGTSGGEHAIRNKDIGSIDYSSDVTLTLTIQFNNLSTFASGKYLEVQVQGSSSKALTIVFATNGIWMSNGASLGQVSTSAIANDTWIEWTFHYKSSNNNVDIYKDGTILESDVDRIAGAGTNGFVQFKQRAQDGGGSATTAYIDNLILGTSLATGARDNMILISSAFTANSAPTAGRIILLEEDVDAITVNTDIKAYVSRDNGITYTQITLTDEGNYDTSKQILVGRANIGLQPSGTSMRYKIETLNNINLKIHGTSLLWES